MTVSALGRTKIEYPDSDGKPIADNEYQFDFLNDTVRKLQGEVVEVGQRRSHNPPMTVLQLLRPYTDPTPYTLHPTP